MINTKIVTKTQGGRKVFIVFHHDTKVGKCTFASFELYPWVLVLESLKDLEKY